MVFPRVHRSWMLLAVAAIALAAIIGGVTYVKFFREAPATYFEADEDHFLFGSIGTETGSPGVPYWIWLVLPRVFPEHLPRPGGYAALGLVATDGHEMPVGLTKVDVGYPRVGINCALCHTARWRERPGDPPAIVPAAPAHQTGVQEYFRFLIACASDPRFNADTILGEIAKNYRLSAMDRLLYRLVIIPSARRDLLRLGEEFPWTGQQPDWGRGRADVFSLAKSSLLQPPAEAAAGASDMTPIWNMSRRDDGALYWDGSNPNLKEVVLASAAGSGAPSTWIDRDMRRWDAPAGPGASSLRRIQNYIDSVPPPKYPFPVDQAAAEQGRELFDLECASCHDAGADRAGTVIPAAEVGTDRHRLDRWTASAATAFNEYGEGHDWALGGFRKTDGYAAGPLDGVWLRAPYLHNGSVPSLADLLEPHERRPKQFWRGYDVYDPVKVGFVSSGPEAERQGTWFDTSKPGNGSGGHPYGTALPADRKQALIEYLKTR